MRMRVVRGPTPNPLRQRLRWERSMTVTPKRKGKVNTAGELAPWDTEWAPERFVRKEDSLPAGLLDAS